MSFNRNKDEDRYNTRQMVNEEPDNFSKKNWLGHSNSKAAGKIDYMLLKGASYSELEDSGRKKSSLDMHLYHLEKDHGLSIEKNADGIHIFSVCRDAETGDRSKEKVGKNEYLPTKEDCEAAIRQLSDENEQARTGQVLDRIEKNVTSKGMALKPNWRMITEENMKNWSS
ncbi:MAG: hypothetical protein R6U68_01060 [Desulfobacteraceae bacterium]